MLNDDVRVLEKSKVKENNIVHPFEIGKALETKGITSFRGIGVNAVVCASK